MPDRRKRVVVGEDDVGDDDRRDRRSGRNHLRALALAGGVSPSRVDEVLQLGSEMYAHLVIGIAVVTGLAVAGCATWSGAVAETRATETPLDLAPRSAEH
jgi:hypothetical protein